MTVNRNGRKSEKMKSKFSKCSKLKRAISHKILKKTSSKPTADKSSSSSVFLLSMVNTATDTDLLARHQAGTCHNSSRGHLLQPLDLVIEEARHQLFLETLREEKILTGEIYLSNFSRSDDSEDIYEEMDLLQTFYENTYDGDYMDMGLLVWCFSINFFFFTYFFLIIMYI